jgi:hypothetical protein
MATGHENPERMAVEQRRPQTEVVVVQPAAVTPRPVARREAEVRVYSHSRLMYWWPVWVAGYTMALLTHLNGHAHQVGGVQALFYEGSNLGVIFYLTLLFVILTTSVTVRGLASVIAILSLVLASVLLAYYDQWDRVLNWFGNLKIHLNLGAYFWFATMVFAVWFLSVFVFDRLSYWRITPGQVTHEFVLGAASKSYDADNMVLEKLRDDFFRHWVLGLGTGDLKISPFGPQQETIVVPNVIFVGARLRRIEHMIATEPVV